MLILFNPFVPSPRKGRFQRKGTKNSRQPCSSRDAMPAPGDPAVLLHRLGTAQREAILPRGMHPARRPSCRGAKSLESLAQVRERKPGCQVPERPGVSELAQAPASSLTNTGHLSQGTPHREPTGTPGECGWYSGTIFSADK